MAKEVGAEALGRFFTDGKVRSRREWRGFKDTFYDYTRWLYIMTVSYTHLDVYKRQALRYVLMSGFCISNGICTMAAF